MVAAVKQVFPRHRSLLQGWGLGGTVAPAMPPRLEVTEKLWPVGFGFPDENHVSVRLRFIRHQRHMRPTKHYRDSSPAEPGRHGIRMGCARGVKGDCRQVRPRREIDRSHRLIDMEHGPMWRREGGKIGHCDLLKVQDSGTPNFPDFRRRSGNQKEGSRSSGPQ
jgi:hypothetical protein